MKQREIVFYSEGSKMSGTIYLPDDYKEGEKRAGIIANSGWTGLNVVYPAMFARALTEKGYVCMGFDYRGFKPSGGMEKYTTLDTEVQDVCNALAYFKAQPEVDPDRMGLIGWGVGGPVCVEATARENIINQNVKAVACMDRSAPGGTVGALYNEISGALINSPARPLVTNLIYGLGGRDMTVAGLKDIFRTLDKDAKDGKINGKIQTLIGVRGPALEYYDVEGK